MNIRPLLHSAVLAVCTSASAAGISITPASPTPGDDIVVEITGVSSCSSMQPNRLEMTDARVIRVFYNDGANIQCFQAMPPPKVTIGRFPAGTYTVEIVPNLGAPPGGGATTTFTVANSAGGASDDPPDNYTGHWLTGVNGEGVFITQFGKSAFVSWLFQGADGKSTWLVMPDAQWGLDDSGFLRFGGDVWRVENQPVSTGTSQVLSRVASGFFYPGVFDSATLRIPQLSVERSLTRFRFGKG